MNFDRLLSHFEGSGQKEVVALAVFYFEEYVEQREVTRAEIHTVIESSRTSIPSSNIPTYLSRLQNDDLLTTTENDGYRLTHDGLEHIKSQLGDVIVEDPRDELFIDTDVVDDYFYERLIMDINECYRVRVNSASLVLTRKLFENLLVDILRWHYGMDDIEMFFDPDQGYHHGLSRLKRNVRNNVNDFRVYSRDIDVDLLDKLDQFKESGDASAHSIVVDISDEEIETMTNDATQLTNILYDIRRGIQYASDE
jgi:hypothetical protein